MSSTSKSNIYFFFQAPVTLKQRTQLKEFIEGIFRKEKKKLKGLNYIFCTDKELLAINRQYLNHDYYTDIISFELSGKNEPLEGDIYISIDRVKENALNLREPLFKELHRVMFHGVLHFCGYQDKTKTQSQKMRIKEERYLSQYFK
ncbi:MAG: rRNA maturation RNase YbeY [Chitinophagaceae bacterium]